MGFVHVMVILYIHTGSPHRRTSSHCHQVLEATEK